MRKLTVKRNKSFVGCLMSLKVYIEDSTACELMINNTPCRKLGNIKNGDEAIYYVDDRAAKVFVIADKLSKGYCNEFYQLPDGTEDITLTGKCKFNPAAGNAFRFDNNNDPAALANRGKGNRKGVVFLCCAIVIGLAVGFAIGLGLLSGDPEPKDFSAKAFNITLTDEFDKVNDDGFLLALESPDIVFMLIEESFDLYPDLANYTITEYGNEFIEYHELDSTLKTVDGLMTFDYVAGGVTDAKFTYICYIYKSGNAFWLAQFAVYTKDAEEYRPQIHEYAKTVAFAN